MPTLFDDFSIKAHSTTVENIDPTAIENRRILNEVMQKHNFQQLPHEWWHFNFCDAEKYPVLNVDFPELENEE